jgi:hypothetical protein
MATGLGASQIFSVASQVVGIPHEFALPTFSRPMGVAIGTAAVARGGALYPLTLRVDDEFLYLDRGWKPPVRWAFGPPGWALPLSDVEARVTSRGAARIEIRGEVILLRSVSGSSLVQVLSSLPGRLAGSQALGQQRPESSSITTAAIVQQEAVSPGRRLGNMRLTLAGYVCLLLAGFVLGVILSDGSGARRLVIGVVSLFITMVVAAVATTLFRVGNAVGAATRKGKTASSD